MAKVIIQIPEKDNSQRKGWAKILKRVDLEQSGGYAFIGDWLTRGKECQLEQDTFVLFYDDYQNDGQFFCTVKLCVVISEGLKEVLSWDIDSTSGWANLVKNRISEAIGNSTEQMSSEKRIDLNTLASAVLIEELKKRGFKVEEIS